MLHRAYTGRIADTRRETALQGGLVMAKSGRLKLGDNILRTLYVYNHSTTVAYLASKATEFGEKRKIKAITPFKVIQGHRARHQSKARMRLPIRPSD